MNETQESPSSDLTEEFRILGGNLKSALTAAWESEERRKLQQDIEDGLSELGIALESAANELTTGETGQRIKADLSDLQESLRTGEAGEKVRSDIVRALRTMNAELEKSADKWSTAESSHSEE